MTSDAFGNVRSPGGEALPEVNLGGDSRFQGMWKDAGTGLYYVRARYYDARTGRFLSRDPAEGQLGRPESFMPYVFANANPYVFRDPTGEFSLGELNIALVARGAIQSLSFGGGAVLRKAVAGALVNVGFEGLLQAYQNGSCFENYDGTSLAVAALGGAAGGAAVHGIYRLQQGLWALSASLAVLGDIAFLEYLSQKQINAVQNRAALACVGDDQIDPMGFFVSAADEFGTKGGPPLLKWLAQLLRKF